MINPIIISYAYFLLATSVILFNLFLYNLDFGAVVFRVDIPGLPLE